MTLNSSLLTAVPLVGADVDVPDPPPAPPPGLDSKMSRLLSWGK